MNLNCGIQKIIRYLLVALLFITSSKLIAEEYLIGVGDQNRVAIGVEDKRLVGSLGPTYQCILDKSGIEYDLRLMPQARMLHELRIGNLHVALPLVKFAKWDEFAIFTSSILNIKYVLISKDSFDLSGNLSNRTFTIMRSSASRDLVQLYNANFEEVTSWTQGISLVKLGRYDGAVVPELIIQDLEPKEFEGLTKNDFGYLPLSAYVAKNIGNTDAIVKKLNQAIENCVL